MAARGLINEHCSHSLSSLALRPDTQSGATVSTVLCLPLPLPAWVGSGGHEQWWQRTRLGWNRLLCATCHVGLGRSHGKQRGQLTCLCPDKQRGRIRHRGALSLGRALPGSPGHGAGGTPRTSPGSVGSRPVGAPDCPHPTRGTELRPRCGGRAAQSLPLPVPPAGATVPSTVLATIDPAFQLQLQPPLVNQ